MAWSEEGLLRWIAARRAAAPGLLLGPGDDAALLELGGGTWALTVDQVIEGVHYEPHTEAGDVGRKLAARNLSDLAAMGACPRFALLTAALPSDCPESWVHAAYLGAEGQLREFEAVIVGGDLARATAGMVATMTLLGSCGAPPARRDRARAGELLFVTGALGGSILGRHLRIEPRVREGEALVRDFGVRCMIDVSDGLAIDLHRLCDASGVGAEIRAEDIPIHRDAVEMAERTGRTPLDHALSDGEDYELLFSLNEKAAAASAEAWSAWRCPPREIGRILPARDGVRIRREGELEELEREGFLHG